MTTNKNVFLYPLSFILSPLIVAVETGTTPAPAATLADWRFDPATNQLQITLQDKITPRYFLLAQPARIVLDLPNTQLGKVATQQNYSGTVRQVRISQFQKDVTRIVLELSPEVSLAPGLVQLQRVQPQQGQGDRWLLRPLLAGQRTPAQAQNSPLPGTLPSANVGSQQPALISVPPLSQGAVITPSTVTPLSTTLPPATFGSQQPAVISVPPLPSSSATPGESLSTKASTSNQPTGQLPQLSREQVIEFGQPLPKAMP